MTKKVYAIARPEDFQKIEERILGDLVKGRLTYFALTVADLSGFSSCFFSPAAPLKRKQDTLFVQDYGKIVRLLLSHPKIRHIEYDPEEPAISAVFDDPFEEENRVDEHYDGVEETAELNGKLGSREAFP